MQVVLGKPLDSRKSLIKQSSPEKVRSCLKGKLRKLLTALHSKRNRRIDKMARFLRWWRQEKNVFDHLVEALSKGLPQHSRRQPENDEYQDNYGGRLAREYYCNWLSKGSGWRFGPETMEVDATVYLALSQLCWEETMRPATLAVMFQVIQEEMPQYRTRLLRHRLKKASEIYELVKGLDTSSWFEVRITAEGHAIRRQLESYLRARKLIPKRRRSHGMQRGQIMAEIEGDQDGVERDNSRTRDKKESTQPKPGEGPLKGQLKSGARAAACRAAPFIAEVGFTAAGCPVPGLGMIVGHGAAALAENTNMSDLSRRLRGRNPNLDKNLEDVSDFSEVVKRKN